MNRIDFMVQLAALLQDISEEERQEAMKYYNDYFDDAGKENEQKVVEELESPAKVAATIKAGLVGDVDTAGEYSESGYTDTRFEQKSPPADRERYRYEGEGQAGPATNRVLKIVLIAAIILVGAPIIIPLGIAVIAVVLAGVFAIFLFFAAIVIASIAVVIAGVSVLVTGIISLVPALPAGIALVGAGLIIMVLGVIAAVASVKLCIVVFPGILRGLLWLIRRPFQRRAVA